jgi:hypothetical protein
MRKFVIHSEQIKDTISVRIEPPKNNNEANIHWEKDLLLEKL